MKGRIPKPWYRTKRKTWCVVIDGRRINLGSDKAEAFRKFHELMSGGSEPARDVTDTVPPAPLPSSGINFAELANRYLTHLRTRSTSRNPVVVGHYFKVFRRAFGSVSVSALTPSHVETAIAAHGRWNSTSAHLACSRLITAMNWAVDSGLIDRNPLKRLKKPQSRSRGVEVIVEAEHVGRMIQAAPPFLADILTAMRDTGCRPGEVLSVTARDYDRSAGVWILRTHKTAHRNGGVRVVHLTPAVVAICDRLAKLHPSGPLFRTMKGQPFTNTIYLPKLVRKLRMQLGLPKSVIPYSFRHTFATDALARGVSDAIVAELMGHKDTGMVMHHYAHLSARAAALKSALKTVRG